MTGSRKLSVKLFACALLLPTTVLWNSVACFSSEKATRLEGYVTSVHMPTGFDVNGESVMTGVATSYGVLGKGGDGGGHASQSAVRVGSFVRVIGTSDKAARTVEASSVLYRDDWDKKLSGFGVIERVTTTDSGTTYRADGYRILLTSNTKIAFAGNLKSLAQVSANTWLHYKGTIGDDGLLVASEARFLPARGKGKVVSQRMTAEQQTIPQGGALLNAEGKMVSPHTKVRMSQAGGWCGWHPVSTDLALQKRVTRVGRRVIPAYQQELADDDSSKIWFRFYVIDEDKIRSSISCNKGLILIPTQVLVRLQNDDQLAALIADAIAFQLQTQSAVLITENRDLLGVELASYALAIVSEAASVTTLVGDMVVAYELEVKMEEQRGRIALSLMADAGYDPYQAPQAWRLMAPKKLPGDLSTLRYPSRSGYQLGVLNLEYADRKVAERSGPAGAIKSQQGAVN